MNVNGYKNTRHTETNKHLLRERWEYRLGTVSDKKNSSDQGPILVYCLRRYNNVVLWGKYSDM